MIIRLVAALSACLLLAIETVPHLGAQTKPDSNLLSEISKIRAIDNHAHPVKFVGEGEKEDTEMDALTIEGLEPFMPPARMRPDNIEYIGAWRALWKYRHDDMSEAHVKDVIEAKRRAMRERGDGYPAWVLDQLGIETMLANRAAMGRGLNSPRFRWVSFVDALILPLDNAAAKRKDPDYHHWYEDEERLFKRYLAESNVRQLPPTLDGYLTKVVTATLERQKREGVVAVKFEAAYLRSLEFDDVQRAEAARVYARYFRGGSPPPAEYKKLQDFLFRFISREAGRLNLPVHIHVLGGGLGAYYKVALSNPALLEPVFNDPALRKTNFVLVHGGWPWIKEVAFMLSKPNVYADFSAQSFLLYPHALADVLREWLEWYPEKVLFGTDASPGAPEVNWEEMGWLTVTSSRQALALALTRMMADGEITRERAVELARMVMRENAMKLYGFKG